MPEFPRNALSMSVNRSLCFAHRLANPGKIPLELIEVQVGSDLGEDDIQRFDDIYSRGEGHKE